MASPLLGRRVLVTRQHPGELGALLEARGAHVVHVPLIAVVEPVDGGAELQRALDALALYDWLVVTSAAGAERVAGAAAIHPDVRLGAVGGATARVLGADAGRPVDCIPTVQHAEALASELIRIAGSERWRMLIAQADLADETLAEALSAAGHEVRTVVAYRTERRAPQTGAVDLADALVLASGSAARNWVDALGPQGPDVIVAIGPATAAVASDLGLAVSGVAKDHTVEGLVAELERLFVSR